MIIGISMDQDICLILGQVSLSLLLSEQAPEGYVWSGGEADKTAGNIQARSFMAREEMLS